MERRLQITTVLHELDHEMLFEHNPSPMWVYDLETLKFLAVNNSAVHFYGYSRDEFLSMTLRDIRPEEDLPLLNANILINTQHIQKSTYWRHKKKDGSIIYVDIHSHLLPSLEKIRARLVMAIDVTDRKLAVDKLEESELKFRTLADSTNAAMFLYKIPKYIYVNKSAEKLTGYSNDELMEMNFWDIVHPDDKELVKQRGTARLSGQKTVNHYELRIVTKSGDVKYIDFTAGVISLNGENVSIGTAYDITERKLAEMEILRAKEKAEEADRLKSTFLENMSHELLTPLNGLLGSAELLKDDLKNSPDLELMQNLILSGKRLANTFNSILDLCSLEANRISFNNKPVNIIEVVSESVSLNKKSADSKGLPLNFSGNSNNILVNGDREMLFTIVNNLISNAVKYTLKGSVTIMPGLINSEEVKISVIDTGIGISPENQKIIFEPFRQVSEGLSRDFEGSGLGLTIAKRFTEILNGRIEFESAQNKGSVFSVTFPMITK